MPALLYRYMYRIGARATFRHHARAEEALQHSSLIATEELTELLKPVVSCPSNIFRCDTRPAKPLDLCLVDLYQNPDLSYDQHAQTRKAADSFFLRTELKLKCHPLFIESLDSGGCEALNKLG